MKVSKSILVLSLIVATVFAVSCKKTDTNPNNVILSNEVVGDYTGQLKNSQTNQPAPATLSVTPINDSMVSIHCISDSFDTTVNMMLYSNNDSVMTCFTGQDFENEYGHSLDNHNFCNSKPQGWHSGWENGHDNWWGGQNMMNNAWNNHMNTQHEQGDQHFGGFYPSTNSCNFTFNVELNNIVYTETFTGSIK